MVPYVSYGPGCARSSRFSRPAAGYVIMRCVLEGRDGAILGTIYAIRNAHLESSLLLNYVFLDLLVLIRVEDG